MNEGSLADGAVNAASAGGGMGAVFFFLRWTWTQLTGRSDRKQALIDAQEVKVDLEWSSLRQELKAEREQDKARLDRIENQNLALRRAFNHIAGALIRLDPHHPALAEADQLLSAAFPMDFGLLAARAEAALDHLHNRGGE